MTENYSGIKENSILNRSKFFHCTQNFVMDGMHDLCEGQFMYAAKLFINSIVTNKKYNLKLEHFNERMSSFDYGPTEIKNKPSLTFSASSLKDVHEHKLQQSAAQIRCLIKVLPFIVSGKINPEDDLVRFITNVGKIMQIVFAPKVEKSALSTLSFLINTHDKEFRELFPHADIINKLNHLFHYALCTVMTGPPQNYVCYMQEHKHAFYKNCARSSNNYINQPSTLAKIGQISQSAVWGAKKDYVREKFVYSFSKSTFIANLEYNNVALREGFLAGYEIKKVDHLKIYSVKYNIGSFVLINNGPEDGGNKFPLFGKLFEMFLFRNDAFFIYEEWPSVSFDENLNAYEIKQTDRKNVIKARDPKPFDGWRSFDNIEKLYIVLHHVL